MATGTNTVADLAENAFATTTVQEYGMDRMNESLAADLAVHNARVNEVVGEIAEPTTERSTIYGTSADMDMVKVDEFGRSPTQKISVGSKVEMPIDMFQVSVGWTATYLRRATVQDMAKKQIAVRTAHLKRLEKDVKEALFGATNYTYVDRLLDSNTLAVKRLLNADSSPIPNGPNGETFTASTHTHYDAIDWAAANSAARIAAIQALLQDVVEHGHGDDVRLYINRAQETDVRALTPNFTPLPPPNVVQATTTAYAVGVLDITRADNRLIGYFDGFPVYTRPWVPALYFFTYSRGASGKPLRFRQLVTPSERGLYLAGTNAAHPLQADFYEAKHGFGAFTRTNGAILYLGAASYADPTFT
jgi:hypothetical protein